MSAHPFDRYASFTDLAALNEASARPLRKSVRVNTLKTSIEDFQKRAKERQWTLTPVAWCKEAFFVEREVREAGIGRDILHQNGHIYLQEAASMLPPALLDVQPGETVFDMSAAPGSKTTQIAARMQTQGVIIANDVQENRLWTLKSALYRLGVTNVIVTKKVGQWFAGHMTERFDRVLCDAPCTAQGTVRKDSDALKYASMENVAKMARLQTTLLESAIHSAKVGGRIVYSTCTLTPEENEAVILHMLNKFSDQLELLDPRALGIVPEGFWEQAVLDTFSVQENMGIPKESQKPMLRLWPQTYDTEGFFCAVLRKIAPTRAPMDVEKVRFQEQEMPRARRDEVGAQLKKIYGAPFLYEEDRLFQRADQLLLSTQDIAAFSLPLQDYSLGLPFAKRLPDGRVLLHHELATLRGNEALQNVLELTAEEVDALLDGKDLTCDPALHGHLILRHDGICVGHGLAKEGKLKNNLPRWMILH